MRITPLLALACCVAGCTPSAIDVHGSRLAEFLPGVASYNGVLAALGPPKLDLAESDGGRVLIYDYARVSTAADDVDPAFPWRTRGAKVGTISVLMVFERDDRLRSWRVDATGRGS